MFEKKDALWVRDKLNKGEIIRGSHVFCGAPMLTEAIGLAGFDIVWIDMEHTGITKETVLNNLIAVSASGAASLVRISWNDPVLAKPILDMGPDALLFPYIRTAEDARLAASACNYPPEGIRGYGPLRALEYGRITQADYVDHVYKNMIRILQIEHIDAVNNLDEILDVEGIDAFIIGPNDLSGSMGHIGRPNCAEMEPVYDIIGEKMSKAGRPFGVSMGFIPEIMQRWINRGAQILFAGYDSGYVFDGAQRVFDGMNKLIGRE